MRRFNGFIAVSAALAMAAGAHAQPHVTTLPNMVIGPGGITSYTWEINDARGTAGPTGTTGQLVSGWSQIEAIHLVINPAIGQLSAGDLTWTAFPEQGDQFLLTLETLFNPSPVGGPPNPGPMDNFHAPSDNGGSASPFPGDGDYPFSWAIFTWVGTYTGPQDIPGEMTADQQLTAATVFDTTGFVNPHPGTFSLHLDQTHNSIDLVYTPVPEPGALSLAMFAAGAFAARRLHRPRNGR